jgi:hypothetical protein
MRGVLPAHKLRTGHHRDLQGKAAEVLLHHVPAYRRKTARTCHNSSCGEGINLRLIDFTAVVDAVAFHLCWRYRVFVCALFRILAFIPAPNLSFRAAFWRRLGLVRPCTRALRTRPRCDPRTTSATVLRGNAMASAKRTSHLSADRSSIASLLHRRQPQTRPAAVKKRFPRSTRHGPRLR